MKRAVALACVSMVLATSMTALPGCGLGARDKALQMLNRGDAYAYRMSAEGDKMSKALESFFDILRGPNPEAIVDPGGPLEKYQAAREDMSALALDAESAYQRVLSMDGVEQEKHYAALMADVARKTYELAEFVGEWFGKALDVIRTLDAEKIRGYLTGGGEFEEGRQRITQMREEISRVASEAKEYRTERDF